MFSFSIKIIFDVAYPSSTLLHINYTFCNKGVLFSYCCCMYLFTFINHRYIFIIFYWSLIAIEVFMFFIKVLFNVILIVLKDCMIFCLLKIFNLFFNFFFYNVILLNRRLKVICFFTKAIFTSKILNNWFLISTLRLKSRFYNDIFEAISLFKCRLITYNFHIIICCMYLLLFNLWV